MGQKSISSQVYSVYNKFQINKTFLGLSMVAWPDSGWLKVLDLKGSTAFFLAFGCGLVYFFAQNELFYLNLLPGWAIAIFVAIGILSFLLFLARLWELFIRNFNSWRFSRTAKQKTLEHLDTIDEKEKLYLGTLVRENMRSFNTKLSDPTAHSLAEKGLVERATGAGSRLEWPHIVPDYVWQELQKRKDEFLNYAPNGR